MVGELLKTPAGRQQLTKSFNLCSASALEDPNNRIDWAGNGVIMVPSQSNDPSCNSPACDIRRICNVMTQGSGDELQRLITVAQQQFGGQCVYVNHDATIASLTNTSIASGDARIWFYQTCSEFAFYQTCDPGSKCPFTQGLNDIASNTNLCRIAYDITPDQIQKRVDWSNTNWG
jgi:serine protease 16